jgi:predicted MPP superfamily phosphohydrolase
MFGLTLTAVTTLMQLYVFWRAATVPWLARRAPRRILIGAGIVLWLLFLASRFLEHSAGGVWGRLLELVGMDWLAAMFLLFVCLLAVDLVTVFGRVFRRRAPFFRGWALAVGGLLVLAAIVQGMRPPVVTRHDVRLAGLPPELDGTVIVALSDLHLGPLLGAPWLESRVEQVRAQRPDMIVLLGDLVEGHGQPEGDLAAAFRGFSAPLGVWAVRGNHESHGSGASNGEMLAAAGIPELNNRWVEVRPGLVLAGVDDLTRLLRAGRQDDYIGRALAGRPPGAVVLLSHSPLQAERAAADGVGLMLSGHTHGGQIWPFGYLVRLTYPFLAGRYEVGGMTLIVTRGAGTWGPRMRLWLPGEILRITLRSPNSPQPVQTEE